MSEGAALQINYNSPGPIAHAFYMHRPEIDPDPDKAIAPVDLIMGPQGSGKTGTSLLRIVRAARLQRPSPLDGVRYSRAIVIRDTYVNLEGTTIPSWHEFFPPTVGKWNGDAPPSHEIVFEDRRGRIHLEVEFVGLGENRIEDVLRGKQITFAYLNEADRLAPEVLMYVRGRVGRYPPAQHGGASWWGVWLDCNAPDTDNYIYEKFFEQNLPGFTAFRQPSGLSARAENLHNLPRGYYQSQIIGQPDWWIRRMILNEFGYSRDGKPVYPEYSDQKHCALEPLDAVEGIPLIIGLDAGGTPAATIWQHDLNGQWRGLDELVTAKEASMGPTDFGHLLRELLTRKYRGWTKRSALAGRSAGAFERDQPMIVGFADPTTTTAGGVDHPWIQIVANTAGFKIKPAITPGGNRNNPVLRQEAIRVKLSAPDIDGKVPAFVISPTMRTLRRGFNSHYRYKRKQTASGEFHDEPEKNHESHVHDSAQYAFVGDGGHLDALDRRRNRHGSRQTHAETDDSPARYG